MVDTSAKQRAQLEVPVIDAASLLRSSEANVIDLRSPSEFALDHVPGAHNVPLFDDVERALVGTLYRQVSPSAAFEEARGLVRRRIRALVEEIARIASWRVPAGDLEARVIELTSGGYERLSSELLAARTLAPPRAPIVLHCWRGGLRSRSVLSLVRELGLERATLLDGGYKSYRAEIASSIDRFEWPRTFVLRGLTGVGKTLVLRALERIRPRWTLDLEELAGHRSSLLGMVGLEPCSQKMFESRLFARLREGFPGLVVVEGESRKVGDVILPRGLWRAMGHALSVELTASVAHRIDVLCADYLATESSRYQLAEQLPRVEARMTRKHDAPSLVSMLERGAERELVEILLEHYYDPLYRHSEKGKHFAARFDADDPARAAEEIAGWIDSSATRA